jgi:ATP-dependent Clp protease adapter protein ClpS
LEIDAWKLTATVHKGGKIEVTIPSLVEGETVEVLVREPMRHGRKRTFGSAKRQVHLRSDFEHLLTDFQDYL